MNILYLAHRIPYPPNKGDKLRAFRQIRHLAQRHDVWCACFYDTPADRAHVEPLAAHGLRVGAVPLNRGLALVRGAWGLLTGRTVTERYYRHAAMRRLLEDWRSRVRFDAVVAFSSSMAPYALTVPASRRVLDLCDLDSEKWLDYARATRGPLRYLFRTEGRRLAALEQSWAHSFDATLLITEAEAEPLRGHVPPACLSIVGNGVDLPSPSAASPTAACDPVVGFIGVMDYRPNIDAVCWFVKQCWPAIHAAFPRAAFRIVGRSPGRAVRRLARTRGVRVVGEVPDAGVAVRGFDVSVAPIRLARGLQNKVLEAMAGAKPVVLSAAAAEGIGARHGHEYLIADSTEETIRSVVRLLGDSVLRRRLGAGARRFVAEHHCWDVELRKFELLVTGALERSVPRPATVAPARDARSADRPATHAV